MNVLIIFGGRSAEHEVSVVSAKRVFASIDSRYTKILVGIDKQGKWGMIEPEAMAEIKTVDHDQQPDCNLVRIEQEIFLSCHGEENCKIDVAIPVLHGPWGEDGTIQGLFEVLNLPYVGSGVMASALCMDKVMTKDLLRAHGIRTSDHIALDRHHPTVDFAQVTETLGLPCFVKPANMGSSVGINKVNNEKEYHSAIDQAFEYDSRVIIEKFVPGREFEIAIYDDGAKVRASAVGEIISNHDFYSYDSKYIDPDGAKTQIPAQLEPSIEKNLKDLAIRVFKIFGCRHLARIDFFVDENDDIYVNEPNTFPGCTSISLYPQLWEHENVSMTELFNSFLEDAAKQTG